MPTNLALNDTLLKQALKVSTLKTKKETVNLALQEFIERRRQKRMLAMEGTVDFRSDWDYKKERQGREPGR